MSGFLDTSVIVRYITGDPPDMAQESEQILLDAKDIHITEGVLGKLLLLSDLCIECPENKFLTD